LLNFVEICLKPKVQESDDDLVMMGIKLMNSHCYVPSLISEEPQVKRSVEITSTILEDLFDWEILEVDESHFLSLPSMDEKREYIRQLLEIDEIKAELTNNN